MSKPIFSLAQIVHQLQINWSDWTDHGEYRNWAGEATITYGFDSGDFSVWGDDITPMTAHQKSMAQLAFSLWDDLVAIDIRPATANESPEIEFAHTSAVEGTGETDTEEELSGTSLYHATIGMQSGSPYVQDDALIYGSWGFLAYIHEIGHALGLTHPGDYNGEGITYDANAGYAQDTGQYTVMSYFEAGLDGSGADHEDDYGVWQYASTPLLHDIAAMQAIYGADMTTRAGDTVYGFGSTAGRVIDGVMFDPYNFYSNAYPVFAIWDAGGVDTLDAHITTETQVIDLREGAYSSLLGLTKNVAIAFGARIENAIGGYGVDTMYGNEGVNRLDGSDGDDTLFGMGADDTLIGGWGVDILWGGEGNDTLRGDQNNDTLWGNDGNDGLEGGDGADSLDGGVGRDTLVGGAGDDHLFGGADNDVLRGGQGSDRLAGAAGADVIDGDGPAPGTSVGFWGGGGFGGADPGAIDVATYASAAAAVGVNLLNPLLGSGDGLGDTFLNIETFELSSHADSFTGSHSALGDVVLGMAGADTLIGNGGNDRLDGGADNDRLNGGAGADFLIGGEGVDTADYAGALMAVVLDRTTPALATGDARGDTFASVERFELTAFADTFVGNGEPEIVFGGGGADTLRGAGGADELRGGAGNDRLEGGLGNDMLFGDGEDDTLFGDAGNDLLTGGAGRDTFAFDAGFGQDRVIDFQDGLDRIDLRAMADNGVHSLRGITIVEQGFGKGLQTVVTIGGDSIVLQGVTAASLTAADFLFA